LTVEDFDELLSIVKDDIAGSSHFRVPIPPDVRLAVTLRYLATGESICSSSSVNFNSWFLLFIVVTQSVIPWLSVLFWRFCFFCLGFIDFSIAHCYSVVADVNHNGVLFLRLISIVIIPFRILPKFNRHFDQTWSMVIIRPAPIRQSTMAAERSPVCLLLFEWILCYGTNAQAIQTIAYIPVYRLPWHSSVLQLSKMTCFIAIRFLVLTVLCITHTLSIADSHHFGPLGNC